MKRTLILLATVALILAACGGASEDGAGDITTAPDSTAAPTTTDAPTTTTTATDPDRQPDDVVLQVKYEGGFVPIEFAYNPLPRYTLLGDGRLVFEGPVPAIFPGPLMPAVQVAQLPPGEVARIIELVDAAGLPDVKDESNTDYSNSVADAPNTVVTYFDENGPHRFSVYALGIGLDAPSDSRIVALQRLVESLDALAFGGAPIRDWSPTSLQAIATPALEAESEPNATIAPWPLATPISGLGDEVFQGLRCMTLEGDELATAMPIFAGANQLTLFDDGEAVYRLTVRPIVPGDAACPAA